MSTSVVDWTLALNTATRLVNSGPRITRDGARAVVADLRECAARAESYVAEVTGLPAASGTAPVLVIDRHRWIQANIDGFRQVLAPLTAKAAAKMADSNALLSGAGARITGVEVGALLSYLAPKVLGQFDPFFPGQDSSSPEQNGGRLLLVAPNIVSVERELDVPPHDFRLWVCLHEETHRVQFTAVPWLRDYLTSLIGSLVDSAELDGTALVQTLRDGVRHVVDAMRNDEEFSIVDLVQRPDQRETIDKITAVMSLLEGHADVVMDSVGPSVIPSIERIRQRFDVRRQGQGLDQVVRKLLGLDAKLRQYRDGAEFCRQVIARVGMSGLNAVWASPETLPTREEIANPGRWLDRTSPTPVAD